MAMQALLERWHRPLHQTLAALTAWLVLASPWLGMVSRVRAGAGFFDWSHVLLGFAALLLAPLWLAACAQGGRWRTYFPWLGGDLSALRRDLAGLAKGQLPSAEGGGLFPLIEGLLLLALVATAVSGAVWFLVQGSDAALAWHGWHTTAARVFAALLLLHVLAVSVHLLDFVRN